MAATSAPLSHILNERLCLIIGLCLIFHVIQGEENFSGTCLDLQQMLQNTRNQAMLLENVFFFLEIRFHQKDTNSVKLWLSKVLASVILVSWWQSFTLCPLRPFTMFWSLIPRKLSLFYRMSSVLLVFVWETGGTHAHFCDFDVSSSCQFFCGCTWCTKKE